MTEMHRRHSLVEAPIEDVWAVVSDPKTHPDWWPEVMDVRTSGDAEEGQHYTRVVRRLGFLDQVDNVWVVERLEDLKEARFRCTVSGTYARFSLTPAQEDTFIEAEVGMLPPSLRWRIAQATWGRMFFRRWLSEVLDALPRVVARDRSSSPSG